MKVGRFDVSGSYVGDCRDLLRELPDACVQTCVTSPPYWGLRDYGVDGQIGLEASPRAYVDEMARVFEEVRRVLRDDGTLWLNLGDSYSHGGCGSRDPEKWPKQSRNDHMPTHRKRETGLKPKDLIGIPWMVAFALRDAGWYLRMDVIWEKVSPMPESVKDRPSKVHEYVFLMSKSEGYLFNEGALGDKNRRSIWRVQQVPSSDAHFAMFPPKLIEPCILAGSRIGDLVLDPFFGSGTTGQVAERNGRLWLGFDLNPAYQELQKKRTAQRGLCFAPIREGGG